MDRLVVNNKKRLSRIERKCKPHKLDVPSILYVESPESFNSTREVQAIKSKSLLTSKLDTVQENQELHTFTVPFELTMEAALNSHSIEYYAYRFQMLTEQTMKTL